MRLCQRQLSGCTRWKILWSNAVSSGTLGLYYYDSVENVPKLMGPASVMPVLGHRVDVPAGRVWVTDQRCARIWARVDAALARRTVLTSDLRKLCGVLVLISSVSSPLGTGSSVTFKFVDILG